MSEFRKPLPANAPASTPTIGRRIGRYEMLELLGRGGMAEVYRARLVGVSGVRRDFAIKRLLPALAADQQLVDMFVAEARVAAQLDHPNIVKVIELVREEREHFLVMELIRGYSLRHVLEALAALGRPMPIGVACYVARETLRAIAHAHAGQHASSSSEPASPVIHRDVNPENLLIGRAGEVKLCDFGIARALSALDDASAHNVLKGKFRYMAPEQILGKNVGVRTDLYAVGLVLWECLVGKPLLDANTVEELMHHVRHWQVDPPSKFRANLPPALDASVVRALAYQPDDRFASATVMGAALDDFLAKRDRDDQGDLASPSGMSALMLELFEVEPAGLRSSASVDRLVAALGGHEGATPAAKPERATVAVQRPIEAPSRRPDNPKVIAILAVALLAVAAAWALSRQRPPAAADATAITPTAPTPSPSPTPTPSPSPTPTPSPSPSPTPSPPPRPDRKPGSLDLNSDPWADVWIDGHAVGRTPLAGLALSPGRHVVRLENPALHLQRSLEIKIESGAKTRRFVELLADSP